MSSLFGNVNYRTFMSCDCNPFIILILMLDVKLNNILSRLTIFCFTVTWVMDLSCRGMILAVK